RIWAGLFGEGDKIDGGIGDDYLVGYAFGSSTVSYATLTGGVGVTVRLHASGAQNTIGGGIDTLLDFSNVEGSQFNDTLLGTGEAGIVGSIETYWGLGGDDFINGGNLQRTTYDGGAGSDTVSFDWSSAHGVRIDLRVSGDQSIWDDEVALPLSTGHDDMDFHSIENLQGGSQADTFTGTDQINGLAGFGGNDTLFGEGGNDILNGGDGNDTLHGGNNDDVLFGLDDADTLNGDAGNDTLDGGDGSDSLNGGLGNDTYVLSNGFDGISDTGGIDTITSTITRSLASFTTIDHLTLIGGNLNGTGNGLANTIKGTAGVNTLDGGTGNDRLEGGAGNDTYVINSTADILVESSGIDTVKSTVTKTLATGFENLTLIAGNINGTGNSDANTITGSTGKNKLSGKDGNDTLNGGSGADILIGGRGRDIMTGGADADDFDFDSISETGRTSSTRDIIRDFRHGTDDIDLSTIDANSRVAGNQKFILLTKEGAAFNSFKDGTDVRGLLRWDQQNLSGTANDKTIIEGDINRDGRADFQIQLTGLKTLTSTDFIL
ncbi:MAG: calcium-binding protein, partial [Xanthobacteraceae bacterium]